MPMRELGFRLAAAAFNWRPDRIAFHLIHFNEDGERCYVHGFTETPLVRGEAGPEQPSFTLGREDAQRVMDDLWAAGLRPTQGQQSEGLTAGQARHLEDMRAIAFAKLDIDAPSVK